MMPRPAFLPLVFCAWLGAAAGARGASLDTLHSFGPAANVPYAGLVRTPAGELFGTTYAGGPANAGAIFELSPPTAGTPGWIMHTLYSFGLPESGAHPMGPLTIGPHGVLYGTTSEGGSLGGGTVFALTPPARLGGAWRQTVLAAFPAERGAPVARLLLGADGALYGTAMAGGSGLGSVFRLSAPTPGRSGWTLSVLHEFTARRPDGQIPLTGLAADAHGALYGTAQATAGGAGHGVVYRLSPPAGGQGVWREEVLFDFPASGAYGSRPDGDLTLGADGALYGTTSAGGARDRGAVFRLNPPAVAGAGWTCSLLYSFTGRAGDASPEGGVVFGPGGTLLGTTAGAVKYQQGTVFELIPGSDARQSWSMQVLARFPSRPRGGGLFAVGDLAGAPDGAFFGVTESGGAAGVGTVFEVRP